MGVTVFDAAPTILNAKGQEIMRVPITLIDAVERCDALLRAYGMQMQIICEHCHAAGSPAPYVQGDNARGGSSFTMRCGHLERRYDFGS